MNLFLDTSVLLAASGSEKGASRALFTYAELADWKLITSPYAIEETLRNLPKLPVAASRTWLRLRPRVVITDDVVTVNRPTLFAASKDRPILFSALASAEVLLTLDRKDFADLLGSTFYGLLVMTPADFLTRERHAGRLR